MYCMQYHVMVTSVAKVPGAIAGVTSGGCRVAGGTVINDAECAMSGGRW
jgi:hypothetical protein